MPPVVPIQEFSAWRFIGVLVITLVPALAIACGNVGNSPTEPSPSTNPSTSFFSLQSLDVTPQGTGVQHGTEFMMEAVGVFPSNTVFRWDFGDGNSASGEPLVTHVYGRRGTFSVSLEVSSGEESASRSQDVRIRSLLGTWDGVVTGHTNVPSHRPIPITSFELTIFTVPGPLNPLDPLRSTYVSLDGRWKDDAGCRVGRGFSGGGYLNQNLRFNPIVVGPTVVGVSFGIESFECNGVGGFLDFWFYGTADDDFNGVEGTCDGGPNCRFRMQRRG